MNPKKRRRLSRIERIQPEVLAKELSGSRDLGMKRDALHLIRIVLRKRCISPDEFREAVRTIGVFSDFRKWKAQLETAYNRQSRKFKRKARPYMVEIYGSLGAWETALQFLSVRKPSSASEIFFGMAILLELDKIQDAKVLATRCRRALSSATPAEQSLLLDTLARFFERTHEWDRAIAIWQQMPPDQPFRRDALSGIVKIHLARAFEAIERGLRLLMKVKEQQNSEASLCRSAQDLEITLDAGKELLKFKRGIEKLLPKETRKRFGISVGES